MTQKCCGLGDAEALLSVYIANRPPLDEFEKLIGRRSLEVGEVASIAQQTGNHWRKIFNVYAKLAFALQTEGFASWQDYRERFLLQAGSRQRLLFSPPNLAAPGVHVIAGKTYAQRLALDAQLDKLGGGFQIDREKRLLVTPYFDYRQLNNEKIHRLVALIRGFGYYREISGRVC